MGARVIAGVVLVTAGLAIFAVLLAAIYGVGGPWTLVEMGMPAVLVGELAGITALCAGAALLVHAAVFRARRKD